MSEKLINYFKLYVFETINHYSWKRQIFHNKHVGGTVEEQINY